MREEAGRLINLIEEHLSDTEEFSLISLPEHLVKLRQLALSPNSDIKKAIPLIQEDPGFTTYLVNLANSAYYSRGASSVHSVDAAVRRVGFEQTGHYALIYATKTLHEVEGGTRFLLELMKKNWENSRKLSIGVEDTLKLLKQTKKELVKSIDLAKLKTTATLYFAGNLAVYSHSIEMIDEGIELTDEDVVYVVELLRPRLIKAVLNYLDYSDEEVNYIIEGCDCPFSYIDIIHKELAAINPTMLSRNALERVQKVHDEVFA